jgi:Flp pilus assembly protein TadG
LPELGGDRIKQLPEAAMSISRPSHPEVKMNQLRGGRGRRADGQIIVVAALAMVAMIGMAALVLEGGNAYAQQRVVQNGADGAANAGAVALAQRLGGVTKTDTDVFNAVTTVATANQIDSFTGYYTNVTGQFIDNGGAVVGSSASAAVVGPSDGNAIPPNAQGVYLVGSKTFPT